MAGFQVTLRGRIWVTAEALSAARTRRNKNEEVFLPAALCVLPSTYCSNCSMLDHGMWVEVKVRDEHLRRFAEHHALGVQASVYT